MRFLLYDGTFEGLLTAVFEVYSQKLQAVRFVRATEGSLFLFDELVSVETDKIKAQRVWKALQSKLSSQARSQLYWSFLSELEGIENSILDYIQYALRSPHSMEEDFGHPSVLHIAQTWKKVGREKHRFEAFVRFELIGEQFFYAPIEPDFNVLPLIAPHFRRRYADQHWLIYDCKRKYGMHYDKDREELSEAVIDVSEKGIDGGTTGIRFDPQEQKYKDLWKNYFKNVNIPARKNTKLHLQHVPKRYWKYLVEKS